MITRAEEYFDIPIRKKLGPSSHGTGRAAQHGKLRLLAAYMAIAVKPSTSRRLILKQR